MDYPILLFIVDPIDCGNDALYSIFKQNGVFADAESFSIWNYSPSSGTKQVHLTSPIVTEYVSEMVYFCLPVNVENAKLTMNSALGELWSDQSYLSIFDPINRHVLLTTTLTEKGELTLDFPRIYFQMIILSHLHLDRVPTIPIQVHVHTPSFRDRAFVTLSCTYSNHHTVVAALVNPFPSPSPPSSMTYTLYIPATPAEKYEVLFWNWYRLSLPMNLVINVTVREREVGRFSYLHEDQFRFVLGM